MLAALLALTEDETAVVIANNVIALALLVFVVGLGSLR